MGSWTVSHRRLKARLVGCSEWESFVGACTVHKILGGFGNIDDNVIDIPSGAYRAVTIRAFDATQGTWSIWWLDGRHPDELDVPVVGRFAEGVGTFFADSTLAGRPIQVRFNWTRTLGDAPRWEQAFSADGGRSWESNWTMDFVRRADDLASRP